MSRTTASIQLKSSSPTPYCTSCGKQFPKNGRISKVRSQTTFASSLIRSFEFWSDRSIAQKDAAGPPIVALMAGSMRCWVTTAYSSTNERIEVANKNICHTVASLAVGFSLIKRRAGKNG
jgi:hypothetical protein